jgi:hypothetical protein
MDWCNIGVEVARHGQGLAMNINKAIRDLYEEKKHLDQVIASLEEMQRNADQSSSLPARRRGRKSMDEESRREVSERMKRYWEMRRTAQDKLQRQAKA